MNQGIVFVQGIVLYLLVYSAIVTLKKRRVIRLLQGLRLRHLGQAISCLAATVLVLVCLEAIGPPFTIGWWSLMGGQGSVVTGGVSEGVTHPLAKPLMLLIPFALLANIPAFAFKEEVWFRRNSDRRTVLANGRVALAFGLIHMVAGVPLSAALALAAFGGLLSWRFIVVAGRQGRHSALLEVARIHTVYNSLIVLALSAVLILRLLN